MLCVFFFVLIRLFDTSQLREYKLLPHFWPRPRFLSKKRPRLGEALDMDHYVKAHHFRRAGGGESIKTSKYRLVSNRCPQAINGILQHDGRVVVCSNTAGGNVTGGKL
jgi:hypothetical protein